MKLPSAWTGTTGSAFSTASDLCTILRTSPLATCDYYTVSDDYLKAADRASRKYVGEIYYVQYNENQTWCWISNQTPDEILLFVNFASGKEVFNSNQSCRILHF
ncbi:hypothetical protein B0O99DRAFT_194542 [Bisporella sp. PMI_857]|nr:hypothetical protein B0O99DRAFT_194542 [Bisporella sp. PMI_857]